MSSRTSRSSSRRILLREVAAFTLALCSSIRPTLSSMCRTVERISWSNETGYSSLNGMLEIPKRSLAKCSEYTLDICGGRSFASMPMTCAPVKEWPSMALGMSLLSRSLVDSAHCSNSSGSISLTLIESSRSKASFALLLHDSSCESSRTASRTPRLALRSSMTA